jgi:hypothetical protein
MALWQGGFGWMGITTEPGAISTPIQTLVNSTSGIITITVSAAALNPIVNTLANGQIIPLRLSGIRQPGNLNGTWPFRYTLGTTSHTFTSVRSFAVLTWDGTGQITYSPKNFIPFINANIGAGNPTPAETKGNLYAEKIARRKRGLPFGLEHGRLKAFKRY